MAQALLYNIRVDSNWAQVMAKDTAATNSNTKSKVANTVADKAADGQRAQSTGVMSKVFSMLGMDTAATEKSTASKQKNWYIQRLLNKSTKTAGYNVGGLSLRIHESLVPAMAILYTSMLPVIAGLLAIGSAAIVAVGGIAGVAAVGLLGWSKRYKKEQESGGFSGGRQPMGGSGNQPDFMSEVMGGFTKFMDHPKVNFAIDWTENLFKTTLPNAFGAFLDSIDIGQMEGMLKMFTDWLPNAAKGLAVWGQALFGKIGPKSLGMINDVFKWIANGLLSISDWLNADGFDEIESLGKNIADFAGSLMQLGKEVLPILNASLSAIYPMPFKPVIEGLTSLLGAIGDSEKDMKTIVLLTKLFVTIAALGALESVISGMIGFVSVFKLLMPVFAIAAEYLFLLYQGGLALAGLSVSAFAALGVLGAGLLLWIMTWDNAISGAIKWWFTNLGTLLINGIIAMYNLVKAELSLIPGINFEQTAYRQYTGFDGSAMTGTQVGEQVIKVVIESNDEMFTARVDDSLAKGLNAVTGINTGLNTAMGGF